MRKRKKYGYFLLTMLIVSGLAGTPTDNSLTKKERTFVTDQLKSTKSALLNTIKDWNESQLNFRPFPNGLSAVDYISQTATTEKELWQLLETTMKAPVNPEKKSEIKFTDEEIVNIQIEKKFSEFSEIFSAAKNKSPEETIAEYKTIRTDHIKYIRNTTEDLRNHITQTPVGWLDCYQIILLISAINKNYIDQLNEIRFHPQFPR